VFKVTDVVTMFTSGLHFTFSGSLDPSFSKRFARELVLATFRPDDPVQPMRAIPGIASIQGADVVFVSTQQAMGRWNEMAAQQPGMISIDLDTGYLRDTNGRSVSGTPARLLSLAPPYAPAGIFRTWILKA